MVCHAGGTSSCRRWLEKSKGRLRRLDRYGTATLGMRCARMLSPCKAGFQLLWAIRDQDRGHRYGLAATGEGARALKKGARAVCSARRPSENLPPLSSGLVVCRMSCRAVDSSSSRSPQNDALLLSNTLPPLRCDGQASQRPQHNMAMRTATTALLRTTSAAVAGPSRIAAASSSRTAGMIAASQHPAMVVKRMYHEKVIDHYENPCVRFPHRAEKDRS